MKKVKFGEQGMKRLLENEDYFSNIFDSCEVDEHGSRIHFYFGGYKYSLTAYNIVNDPLYDIKHALIRAKRYYQDKIKNKKDS